MHSSPKKIFLTTLCFLLSFSFYQLPQVEANELVEVSFQELSTIRVAFDTPVDQLSVVNPDHYSIIDSNIKHPVLRDELNIEHIQYFETDNSVLISLENISVQVGEIFNIQIHSIRDLFAQTLPVINIDIEQPSFLEAEHIQVYAEKDKIESTSYVLITAYATDTFQTPVQNTEIRFELIGGNGDISPVGSQSTNKEGKVTFMYVPNQNDDLAVIKVYLRDKADVFATTSVSVLQDKQYINNNNFNQVASFAPVATNSNTPVEIAAQTINEEDNDSETIEVVNHDSTLQSGGKVLGTSTSSLPQTGAMPFMMMSFAIGITTWQSMRKRNSHK